LDIPKEEIHDDDEQEVPGKDDDNEGEPPSKKAKKINNRDTSTYNERFGVCIFKKKLIQNKKTNFILECL
jgi:hypothetical protein